MVNLKNEASGVEIFLIITSHVSQQSIKEVRDEIKHVKLHYVMVELDLKRYNSIMQLQSNRVHSLAFIKKIVQTLANGNTNVVEKLVLMEDLIFSHCLMATWGLDKM